MRILIIVDGTPEVVADAVADVRRAGLRARESWSDSGELQSWMPEYISRIVPVGILTMLRRGEILGLRDRDIDFATGSIAVFSQRQDGHEVRTKTRAGRRNDRCRARRSCRSPARPATSTTTLGGARP
jgi:integrase